MELIELTYVGANEHQAFDFYETVGSTVYTTYLGTPESKTATGK